MELPQMILNEESIVCRTCLKVLDHLSGTGFTYLDDETSYVKDVGSIREMLQFCIPELDLYVSNRPVVCYGCLPILVQVYNFKIKCLSGENIIKDYITRNNLKEYNHVNLNCVLIEDLKMKSQKLLSSQIENKIKLLLDLPDKSESHSESAGVLSSTPVQQKPMMIITPISVTENETNNTGCQLSEIDEEDTMDSSETAAIIHDILLETSEKTVKTEIVEPDESMDGGSQDLENFDVSEDFEANSEESDDPRQEPPVPKPPDTKQDESHVNIVAVRKDLFDSSQPPPQLIVKEIPKEQPSLILNKGMMAQNGRIVIKIDRKKLQSMAPYKPLELQEVESKDQSKPLTPSINTVEVTDTSIDSSPKLPKIVSVSTVDTEEEDTSDPPDTEYKCNKCNYETKDVIQMYDHNRRFHSFDYTCQHCPFSTSKVELLGKHVSMVHPQSLMPPKTTINFKVTENYACSICPFSVKSLDLLRSHHMSAHGRSDENTLNSTPKIVKRLEYTCDVCPYTTKDKSNLRKHLFTHGTKPLTCDHCCYKCVSPYQLRRHQKQKHGKEADPRARNHPYPLPDFKKEKQEALDNFKITLETIKREIEKEIAQS
ncbi:zinc finger protein 711-like isoform X6 [Anthonomus grandis grandis]|uniref:zinc finger protein 711-like isoform X6 n=1 Tax=Anthonomus grandis grandis TaxID=2921223 RepID=UPI002165D972|nr:zinc finger protein 711-like isoform X6 [Anthonomus grandis grandis]